MTSFVRESLPDWRHLRARALVAAAAGLVVLAIAGFLQPHRFLSAYLVGFLLALSVTVGSLPLLMVHHLAGGGWGYLIRRILEAASRTWPLLALMVIPLWFGHSGLYSWSATGADAAEKLAHKEPYLNPPFFLVRSVIYFCVWGLLATLLNRESAAQDVSDDPVHTKKLKNMSGPGLIVYSLTMTFAAFDWLMSLEPLWYSTIFGVIVMLGQVLAALTFSIVVLSQVAADPDLEPLAAPKYLNDVGNMTLAFLMLWAYAHFSQYLIIWSGDIAEETAWYVHRTQGLTRYLTPVLAALHFGLPFLLLLQRSWKRDLKRLSLLAGGLFFLRFLAEIWLVEPSVTGIDALTLFMDAAATVGVGGLWLAYFTWEMTRRPLVPKHDPLLPGVFERLTRERVGDVG